MAAFATIERQTGTMSFVAPIMKPECQRVFMNSVTAWEPSNTY